MNDHDNGKTMSWIAIGLSLLALIVSFLAITQVSSDAREELSRGENVQVMTVADQVELDQARQRLTEVRNNVAENGQDAYQEAQAELADIRADLRTRYQNADEQTQQTWQNDIEPRLEEAEQALRENSLDALSALDRAIESLESEIRKDTSNE